MVTASPATEARTSSFAARLTQEKGYRFAIHFDPQMQVLHSDEPPPLGAGTGPSPVQLIAAAVANCLSASLVFALNKFRLSAEPVQSSVEVSVGRNEQKRLRIQWMRVRLTLGVAAPTLQSLDRALLQFEEFCTVTESVRLSFPIDVEVYDSEGQRLK
jgi:uncharacterized OsmC-like protein